jgi:hypothetical protein
MLPSAFVVAKMRTVYWHESRRIALYRAFSRHHQAIRLLGSIQAAIFPNAYVNRVFGYRDIHIDMKAHDILAGRPVDVRLSTL